MLIAHPHNRRCTASAATPTKPSQPAPARSPPLAAPLALHTPKQAATRPSALVAGFDVVTGCAGIAVVRQLLNPSLYRAPKEAVGLPAWYADKYASGRALQVSGR